MEVTNEMLKVARSMQSFELMIKRIIELHEANKQKPEPYCYMSKTSEGEFFPTQNQITENDIPLYATPPTQEPLRDEQISLMAHNDDEGDWNDLNYKKCWYKGYKEGFRRAEQAHGIGEKQCPTPNNTNQVTS